jgi:hypothetical protein
VIERKCIRALEAQLKRWKKTPPKKYNSRGREEEDDDDDDEWVPPVLHSVEAASAIQSQNCKLCYYTLRDLSLSLSHPRFEFQNNKRNSY